ncbi:hypothetical protein C8R43DRAFT_1136694 [Mycena crocata]|nr:hypothetical protein C8R43DRAFT_1136694 [Mycena crocata]
MLSAPPVCYFPSFFLVFANDIALAFGYQFNTLDTSGKPNELNDAFTTLFHGPRAALYAAIRTVQGMNPLLALLPLPGGKALSDARIKMDTIGAQIVADRKAEIKASEGEKGVPSGRDLLSVLLKAEECFKSRQRWQSRRSINITDDTN